MEIRLTIGDFSRMTHLSIKALRHYHDLGLLDPVDVDPQSGYRFYSAGQVPTAQVIRRFRALGMPVEHIRAVVDAPDLASRNAIILEHLKHMERQLEQTQETVASLRALLEPVAAPVSVGYRFVAPICAAVIAEGVALGSIGPWWSEAFAELYRAVSASGLAPLGPGGGLYPTELFTDEVGESIVYVPLAQAIEPSGRVRMMEIPAAELAIATHYGALDGMDRTYGALGTYVSERALGVDGPIREHYLVTSEDVVDEAQLRTEICWPVFQTARGA
jgi:DNA-binding transcriptional MerR regulator/effector-binding domain-containing protein